MKEIYGIVQGKDEQPLEKAMVALLNDKFEMEFSTETDKNGKFDLPAESKCYPFFIAVKEYKENYLEYWCQNIDLQKDLEINPKIDKLEIYGLHCFRIKGASNYLMIYFRPMSLTKFQAKEKDIAPGMTKESLTVSVNGEFCEILVMTHVDEQGGEEIGSMTSYLVQVSTDGVKFREKNRLEISITDAEGDYGEASLFFKV